MIKKVVDALQEQHDLNENKAEQVLETVFEAIEEGLFDDGEIRLKGLGRFHIVERAARKGRNFKTHQPFQSCRFFNQNRSYRPL